MISSPRWKKFLRIAATIIAVAAMGLASLVLAAIVFGSTFLIDSGFKLLFGWAFFLYRNLGEIEFDPARLAAGLAGAFLAWLGLHLLASRWWRWAHRDGTRWSPAWSISIFAAMFALALSAMAVAGIGHQIAWLKGEPKLRDPITQWKSAGGASTIEWHLQKYAEANGGKFPENLSILASWSNDKWSETDDLRNLVFFAESRHSTPEPWFYFGGGRLKSESPPFLLLASPRSSDGKRFIATSDRDVQTISEAEFQALLERQRSQLSTLPTDRSQ